MFLIFKYKNSCGKKKIKKMIKLIEKKLVVILSRILNVSLWKLICDCTSQSNAAATVTAECLLDIGFSKFRKSLFAEPEETMGVIKWSCASCVLHLECWPGRQYALLQEMNWLWSVSSSACVFPTIPFNFFKPAFAFHLILFALVSFPGTLFFQQQQRCERGLKKKSASPSRIPQYSSLRQEACKLEWSETTVRWYLGFLNVFFLCVFCITK